MICRTCKAVAEVAAPAAGGPLANGAEAVGFEIERTVVEAEGLCPKCQKAPTP